jgi:hypothetical protein
MPATATTKTITGLDRKPAALLDFSILAPAHGVTNDGTFIGAGFHSPTVSDAFWVASCTSDNDGTQDGHTLQGRVHCAFRDALGGLLATSSLSAYTADGFTASYGTVTGSQELVNFLALAGEGFKSKVLDFTTVGGETGPFPVTGSGFPPQVVIFLSGPISTSVPSNLGNADNFQIGAMDAAGRQFVCQLWSGSPAPTTDAKRYFNNAACLASIQSTGEVSPGTLDSLAAFSAMGPDGFTINFSDSAVPKAYGAWCIGGLAHYRVDNFQRAVQAAPYTTSVNVGFRPKAVILASTIQQAAGLTDHEYLSLGVIAGNGSRVVAIHNQDNLNTSNCVRRSANDRAVLFIGNSGIAREATGTLTATGFDLGWVTADASTEYYSYIALG